MSDIFAARRKRFIEIAQNLADQFDKKNRDYNDSYFTIEKNGFPIDKKLAEVDFYLQIRRKISRIASFAERKLANEQVKNLVDDETEEDTIKDIAIYCVMELIKREQLKTSKNAV
jgi:hypothetical protein